MGSRHLTYQTYFAPKVWTGGTLKIIYCCSSWSLYWACWWCDDDPFCMYRAAPDPNTSTERRLIAAQTSSVTSSCPLEHHSNSLGGFFPLQLEATWKPSKQSAFAAFWSPARTKPAGFIPALTAYTVSPWIQRSLCNRITVNCVEVVSYLCKWSIIRLAEWKPACLRILNSRGEELNRLWFRIMLNSDKCGLKFWFLVFAIIFIDLGYWPELETAAADLLMNLFWNTTQIKQNSWHSTSILEEDLWL